jgi:hypothetical protein
VVVVTLTPVGPCAGRRDMSDSMTEGNPRRLFWNPGHTRRLPLQLRDVMTSTGSYRLTFGPKAEPVVTAAPVMNSGRRGRRQSMSA